jgi:hypothetical protein
LLVFTEWIEEHSLPPESELLEVFGLEICLLDGEEKDALKQHDSYLATVSIFTNLGIGKTLEGVLTPPYPSSTCYKKTATGVRQA